MKYTHFAISLLLAAIIGSTSAKVRIQAPHKNAMMTQVEPTHTRRVRADLISNFSTPCQQECLFKDDHNFWCVTTASPMLSAGWQVVQTSDEQTYWTIQFQPYIETQLSILSNFQLQRLFAQQFDISITKFQLYFYYGLGFYNTGSICSSFGYATDDNAAKLQIKVDYSLVNAYKTVFDDLNDLTKPWTAKDAKLIDEYSFSNPQEVILNSFQLFPQAAPYSFWGGDPTGVNQPGCFAFGAFDQWAPYYASLAFKGLKYAGVIADDIDMSFGNNTVPADKSKHKKVTNHGKVYEDKGKQNYSGKECQKMRQNRKKY